MFLLRHHRVIELYLDPKTPVYNDPSTDVPLSVCALQCTILGQFFFHVSLWQFILFHLVLFSCYTLFILKCFHAAPFPCWFFCVVIFFMQHYFHIVLFPCCTLFILHNFHLYLFSSYTLFMLHFVDIAQFSFVLFSCYTLFVYCTISYYTFTRCKVFVSHSLSMLHFVPIALLPEVRCSKDSHKHIKWRDQRQQ